VQAVPLQLQVSTRWTPVCGGNFHADSSTATGAATNPKHYVLKNMWVNLEFRSEQGRPPRRAR